MAKSGRQRPAEYSISEAAELKVDPAFYHLNVLVEVNRHWPRKRIGDS